MEIEKNISVLIGKIIKKITRTRNKTDNEELTFYCNDDTIYKMYHYQDCCECVDIDDICGDMDDLLNTQIIKASERTNESDKNSDTSYTWTYYTIATIKGYVDIRWYGESNGYYSERVGFVEIKEDEND